MNKTIYLLADIFSFAFLFDFHYIINLCYTLRDVAFVVDALVLLFLRVVDLFFLVVLVDLVLLDLVTWAFELAVVGETFFNELTGSDNPVDVTVNLDVVKLSAIDEDILEVVLTWSWANPVGKKLCKNNFEFSRMHTKFFNYKNSRSCRQQRERITKVSTCFSRLSVFQIFWLFYIFSDSHLKLISRLQ